LSFSKYAYSEAVNILLLRGKEGLQIYLKNNSIFILNKRKLITQHVPLFLHSSSFPTLNEFIIIIHMTLTQSEHVQKQWTRSASLSDEWIHCCDDFDILHYKYIRLSPNLIHRETTCVSSVSCLFHECRCLTFSEFRKRQLNLL
jgi:hypothetical protein